MNGALLRTELRRTLRNRRTFVFAAGFPIVFYLLFTIGDRTDSLAGLDVKSYFMVSMASYGAMNALFTGGGLIAAERAAGWSRQLRIAGLRGRDYVLTKGLMAYVAALPGLLVVFLLGGFVKGVHLSAVDWVLSAVSILVALLPVAALGVAVGYLARPATLQPLFGIGSAILALLGGVWFPVEGLPNGVQDAIKLFPTYWSTRLGRGVITHTGIGVEGVLVLVVWTAGLGAVAVTAYRRDSLRPGPAGTT